MTPGPRPGRRLDRSGSVVVEFALTAPILITLLLGLYDIGPTLMARFKLASTTNSIADLAAQASSLQTADITSLFNAGTDGMTPFSGSTLSLRVTNIASDGVGNAFVYWSCATGTFTPKAVRSSVTTTPTGTPVSDLLLLTPVINLPYIQVGTNTSFVMVESSYLFTAPAGLVLPGQQTMINTAYSVPRVSTFVSLPGVILTSIPRVPLLAILSNSITFNGITCNLAL